jgi:hypothetical protein
MVTILAFIVLGGGAYAATQLPKNSVGSKQIRNGSIKPKDLSARAKRALIGTTGPTGPQGQSAPVDLGAAQLFTATNASAGTFFCCDRIRLLAMALPAGPGLYLIEFEGVISEPTEYGVDLFISNGSTDLATRRNGGDQIAISVVAPLSSGNEIAVDLDTTDTDQENGSYEAGALKLTVVKLA